MRQYYEARAREYDDWYLGLGRFAERERPGWERELAELRQRLAALEPARTLDVACGTGFLTRHLPGCVTGLDQSRRMIEIARERVPGALFVQGDGLAWPFAEHAFERVFAGHFYGHLDEHDRERFLAEARRVAPEWIVCDAALRPDRPPAETQERVLNDGSRWRVFKRFFTPKELVRELGHGEVLLAGKWFVLVRSWRGQAPRSQARCSELPT
jgi:ubiquinone/menaquinone biosynthesis C-methylase UbiE